MKRPLLAVMLWAVCLVASASPASILIEQGNNAFAKQDYNAALAAFGRVLKEFPDDPQTPIAAFLRGVSQYQLGQPQSALDSFQKLDRTWPLSAFRARLPYWKGVSALAAGLLPVADRELSAQGSYPDEKPWYVRSLFQLGLVRLAQKQPMPAIDLWKKFLTLSTEPDLRSRAFLLIGQESQRENSGEAGDWYRKASLEAPGSAWDREARKARVDWLLATAPGVDAVRLVEDSAQLFPSERDFWDTRRIEANRKAGNRDATREALQQRLARESDPLMRQKLAANLALVADEAGAPEVDLWAQVAAGPDADLAASAGRRQAALLESFGEWGQAARLLATHPEREAWMARAAQDFLTANEKALALSTLGLLLSTYPQSTLVPDWLDARSGLLLANSDSAGALRDLDRVLKNYPAYTRLPEIRYQMGLVYLRRDEPLRAEAWFYGLINDLKSGELYQRALLARGQCYVNAGKPELARGTLERLIRESPGGTWTADAWYALALTYLADRNLTGAWDAFSRASILYTDPMKQAGALWDGLSALAQTPDSAAASQAYRQFAQKFSSDERANEALYRSGAVWAQAKNWKAALERWQLDLPTQKGIPRDETRLGVALALVQTDQFDQARAQLDALELETADGEFAASAWFQFGQAATGKGQGAAATTAFETLIRLHPASPLVEKALPRAAGALLGSGDPTLALERYRDYFSRFGQQTASASVARAAAAASALYPDLLEKLVKASREWPLAPEVKAEFDLAWWKSQLDVDPALSLRELQALSREAPWTSQRSQALYLAGQWSLGQARLDDARSYFDAAQALGDDLSVFRARLGASQVTDREGHSEDSARQKEAAEKAAGPGVPLEFRVAALKEALALWKLVKSPDDQARVTARLALVAP